MILARLPDLPPAPETAANAGFRQAFYRRWGRENAIVCGHARAVDYAPFTQTLSVKLAWNGAERFGLRERDLVLDDDNFLVLNEGRHYGSRLRAPRPVSSFALFFRPGLQREAMAARRQSWDARLDDPTMAACDVEFTEHLRPHDPVLGAHLRALHAAVQAGERSDDWLDQQAWLVLDRLITLDFGAPGTPPRRAQAQELARRLRIARDLIESASNEPLTLDDLAAAAGLSRFHFVRGFKRQFGLTPYAWLTRKRVRAAQRLMATGEHDAERLAQRCGFGSRFALRRGLQRFGGAPSTPGEAPAAGPAAPPPAATDGVGCDPHAGVEADLGIRSDHLGDTASRPDRS